MQLLKFGGSSVASPDRIKSVIAIVRQSLVHDKAAVVCSAFGGVTDQLIDAASKACKGDESYIQEVNALNERHLNAVRALVGVRQQSKLLADVKMMLNELEDILKGIFLIKELSAKTRDHIMSFGERLSCFIIAEGFNDAGIPAQYLDAREVVRTDNNFGNAQVDFDFSDVQIEHYFSGKKELQVITGFIGSDEHGNTTTLGRSGSDYTASIFGAALKVSEIQIWTDVDGILTADPRKVAKALSLNRVSYEEATELSHFGAKVIFPATMLPAKKKNIPIRVMNTFRPDFEGTLISQRVDDKSRMISGISSMNKVAVLNLQGSGLLGAVGFSMRVFSALSRKRINVILISQASSEYTLCIAVNNEDARESKRILEEEFKHELQSGLLDEIKPVQDLCIVAIVGENMVHHPGIAGKMFSALGANNINVVAIAQGSSERNVSVVIDSKDESKALNALHDSFFLSQNRALNLFVIGSGLVGGALLEMIRENNIFLQKEHRVEPRVVALTNSRKMLLDQNGLQLTNWKDKLDKDGKLMNLADFIQLIHQLNLPNSVLVDCTASDAPIEYYESLLKARISIVTPNKRANSGPFLRYQQLKEASFKNGSNFFYETNVGAGLPIINTLNDLIKSGDKITRIEAVLSGTISFIFNSFCVGKKFSDVVLEAKQKGYTEPDPRDDLNGMDVARKLLILSRECGLTMEMKDISLQAVVPDSCLKVDSVDAFFTELKNNDAYFEQLLQKAMEKGKKLCYIASLVDGKATVSLQEVDAQHPFYSLSGSDNIVSYTTHRYKDRPLVVRGPGAGAEVTAAGVFADIIRIANYLK